MFVILISYKKPLEEIDVYLDAHRSFLDEGYKNNYFIASGPQNPRTGGVILSQLKDKNCLEKFLEKDPFYLNDIGEYNIIEFIPVKYHNDFSAFIENK